MTLFFLPVALIFWHVEMKEQESDLSYSGLLNQMESSCQRTNGAFFSIRALINSSTYSETDGQLIVPKET